MNENTIKTEEFVVEIRHLDPVAGSTLIRLETDEKDYAELVAGLGVFHNSWKLVSKNF